MANREMKSPQSNPGLPSAPRSEQRETPSEVYLCLTDGSIHTDRDSSVTPVSSVADPNAFILTETQCVEKKSWAELAVEPKEPGESTEHTDERVGKGSYESTKAGLETHDKEREASTRRSKNSNAIPDNKRV